MNAPSNDQRIKQAELRAEQAQHSEREIRASELSYRRLFEAAKDGILILNADTGCITDANPFLVTLLGFSRSEMMGKTVAELSPFKDIGPNQAMLERLQKDGYVRHENLPLETRDGRKVAVEFVSNVYQAGDKKVIQCNIRDITERRRMETALTHFRAIVESSSDAIMSKDLAGIITSWNKGAEKIFGFSADEMVGASILRLIPDDRREEEDTVMEQLARGESVNNLETVRRTNGGKLISVSVTISPIKDIQGKVIGVSKVMHDITVRKEHEREIERLSRLYAALSQINQAIVTLNTRTELFTKICQVLVEIGKLRLAWVGWLDTKTHQVTPVAHYGDHTNYLSTVTVYADDRPEGRGPTGTAIREQRNLICNDFKHDPHTLPWRRAAEQAGLQASASLLIRLGGVICGAITVYAGERDFFQDKEIALLEEAVADLSFALDNFVHEEARQQAEIELRRQTALLEAQVDSSLDGILVVNDQGKKILQNQRLNELLRIPPEAGGNIDDLVQIQFVTGQMKRPGARVNQLTYLAPHSDEVSRDEVELIEGTFLERYSAPVRDKAGKHYGRIWTFRDITERKRIEARFRRLVDSNAQGVVFWNTQGLITEANAAFLKMVGYTRADLDAGPIDWPAMTPPEYAELDLRALKELATTGICKPFEKEYIRKDGKRVSVLIGAAVFEDDRQEGVGFVLDLTERKMLEQQFRQSQKMESIGTLAGGVAHDFNNILAVIQMQASLLRSEGVLSGAQTELADDIGITVQRAAALTRQLLMFSRKEVLQLRDLDLNRSVAEMTKMLTRLLGENITVKLKLADHPMLLHADAGMMDQVLMNLAVNARDAMPEGGRLVIETAGVEIDEFAARQMAQARPGSFVRLSVSDNGCGIPPENFTKIFEPFFTTKDIGKGTGLGLATVFGIAQQHHGWVNVYSEAGHGAVFKVYLPRLAESHDTTIIKKPQLTALTGHETILLVEDEPTLRSMIGKTLTRLGYHVLEAATGVKALEVWKAHPAEIHLLLTDLMMPDGMTGKELGQHLAQEHPTLKVIYMSGYSADIVAKDLPLQEGVNFLIKPFPSQKLAETIRECLDNGGIV